MNHPKACFKTGRLSVVGLLLTPVFGFCAVTTDGTLGASQTLSGPEFVVDESLGVRAGDNLFHSFLDFGVAGGESVRFTGSADIANVISRVTGGAVSWIDGALRSEIGQADFYFFNPAGVVFGPDASLDLPAALHLATGDYLRFADDARFAAALGLGSTLSVSPPEEFGFLQGNRSMIRVHGSHLQQQGGPLSLEGPAIEIEKAVLTSSVGGVHLLAAESAGGVNVRGSRIETGGDSTGSITIRGAALTVTQSIVADTYRGDEAADASVSLVGKRVYVSGSRIEAGSSGAGQGSDIYLIASGDLVLNEGATVEVYGEGGGAVGGLYVQADRLRIAGSETGIRSYRAQGDGDAGFVRIDVAGALQLLGGAEISSETQAMGNASDLYITAGQLRAGDRVDGGAFISNVAGEGGGNGGALRVVVEGDLMLLNDSYISSDTYGSGDAGGVDLVAGSLFVDGAGSGAGISSATYGGQEGRAGDAGWVRIAVRGDVVLRRGGWVDSGSEQGGGAGGIQIAARNLWIEGGADSSGIASESINGGAAGEIELWVQGEIGLNNGAYITTTTNGGAEAGDIRILAGDLRLVGDADEAEVTSDSFNGGGAGGGILIQLSGDLVMSDTSAISSSTDGAGAGGSIRIEAENIQLAGSAGGASIASDSGGVGDAGSIKLLSRGDLRLEPGSFISSDTYHSGNGGLVRINAGNLYLLGHRKAGASISADATEGSGNAGHLFVQVDNRTLLANQAYIASDTYADGRAGNILLDSAELRILGSAGISSDAIQGAGDAGRVEIRVSGALNLRNGGFISTSTLSEGDAGELLIHAGRILIDGGRAYQSTELSSLADGQNGITAGEVGSLFIETGQVMVQRGGEISIESLGRTRDRQGAQVISILADDVQISDGAKITSAAEGRASAASIFVQAEDQVIVMDASAITTSAENADGGAVSIIGGPLYLASSKITTSAMGLAGNGGDILLQTDGLALDRGFIQANTAATGASGGDIHIQSPALLVAANQRFTTGGSERLEFDPQVASSVIQAAAPDGIDGEIQLEVPNLGLSATILSVGAGYATVQEIGRDPCQPQAGGAPSSLVAHDVGRGGVRWSSVRGRAQNGDLCNGGWGSY